MILNEEHARKTICPILSMAAKERSFCLAVECMMWVYRSDTSKDPQGFCGLVPGYASLMKEEDFKMYE